MVGLQHLVVTGRAGLGAVLATGAGPDGPANQTVFPHDNEHSNQTVFPHDNEQG